MPFRVGSKSLAAAYVGSRSFSAYVGDTPITGGGAWPPRGEDGSLASLALDFVNDRYWWNGSQHTRAELTTLQGTPTWGANGVAIDGTDRLQIPAGSISGWFDFAATTVMVEHHRTDNAAETCQFSMRGGSGGTATRLEMTINTDRRGRFTLIDGAGSKTYASGNTAQSVNAIRTDRGKTAMSWEVGSTVSIADRGVVVAASAISVVDLAGPFPTAAAIGYRLNANDMYFNGDIASITVWPKKFSDTWIGEATMPKKSLYALGDSFVTQTYIAADAAYMLEDDRAFAVDGVGNTSLTDQAVRFASATQYHDWTPVIIDGGLTTLAPASIAAIDDIASRLSHNRWLYVQSSPNTVLAGLMSQGDYDVASAAIRAHVGETRFVEWLPRAQSLGDGSPEDNADIAAGLVPRSLRTDDIHMTTAGHADTIGYEVAAKLTANGW